MTDQTHGQAHEETPQEPALAAEDRKLVTLARSARARTGAPQGAALRDADGRTYAAATVDLPSLRLGPLEVCVAMAVASGARGVEAAVLLGALGHDGEDQEKRDEQSLAAVRDLGGPGVPVLSADERGTITGRRRT